MRMFVLLLASLTIGGGGAAARGPDAAAVQFIAFGDAGTGSPGQLAVGAAMAKVCAERGCDFALELGDNFYPSGVTSANDVLFETRFETPYRALDAPVWVVLGNHDNSIAGGEGAGNVRGDHQVAYHARANRPSQKWRMPARYYSFTAGSDASGRPLAEFFALDSSPLAAVTPDPNPMWAPAAYGPVQQRWLTEKLRTSAAIWKIAFAHHPYISNGLHGNAGSFDGHAPGAKATAAGAPWKAFVDETVCAEGVDLFVAGHDHDLQFLEPVARCGKTQFIVSGAAAATRRFLTPPPNTPYWQQDQTLGFFWLRLEATRFTVAAYTLSAEQEPVRAYERTLPKP